MVLAKGLRPTNVVSAIILVRILSVFLIQTWYVPDEYWQSLEVAHKQVFGYGATTWEWKYGIRSYIYPCIISIIYYALKFTGLDYPEALIFLPRIFQALLSAAGDYHFYKWTGGRKWALFLILTSWFWFYTSGRTLLQTTETALVTIGLSVFPFKTGKLAYYEKESTQWIWLAVISVFLRPSSAPIWIVLALYNMFTTNQSKLKLFVRTYVPIGLMAGGALVALDSYFHGSLIITPWEFVRFNVLHDIASFYGQHPWHWYLTQGLPAVLGINILSVLLTIYNILRRPKENRIGVILLSVIVLHVALYSFIPHKEFRFVLPLLPIFLYLAQDLIVPWSRKALKWQLYLVAGIIFFGNALPAYYFGTIHQSGTLAVMPVIRDSLPNNRSSVTFLMPCHSTPLYSHLHMNITTRYLNCDPPINKSNVTEAEVFFNNPQRWWKNEYSMKQLPHLVVIFDKLRGRVENILGGYRLIHELPHTHFPEGEVGEKVLVYQKKESRPPADETV